MKTLLLMLTAMLAFPAVARDFTYEGLTYTVIDETAKTCQTKEGVTEDGKIIMSGNTVTGDLVIPSEVSDGTSTYTVVALGDLGFYNCDELTSVVVPETVEVLGTNTFRDCNALTSVKLPGNITQIMSGTFYYCTNLESIAIPEGVKYIGLLAFANCENMTSVSIPESVTYIELGAFSRCDGLTKAEFASIESLCKIDFHHEDANPLYQAHHLYINGEEVTDLVIPAGVTLINDYVFYGASNLISVSIPESVETVRVAAFFGCTGLTSVTFPEGVDLNIGPGSFYECTGLTAITIPEGITTIGPEAFGDCSGLTTVTIPESLTYFGGAAFYGCSGLSSVYYLTDEPVEGWVDFQFSDFTEETYENATLYLTENGVEKAKTMEPWKNFKHIEVYNPAGIEEVMADGDAAPCEIYNLNGVKVGSDLQGLTPGIYIRRQGPRTEKLVVK